MSKRRGVVTYSADCVACGCVRWWKLDCIELRSRNISPLAMLRIKLIEAGWDHIEGIGYFCQACYKINKDIIDQATKEKTLTEFPVTPVKEVCELLKRFKCPVCGATESNIFLGSGIVRCGSCNRTTPFNASWQEALEAFNDKKKLPNSISMDSDSHVNTRQT